MQALESSQKRSAFIDNVNENSNGSNNCINQANSNINSNPHAHKPKKQNLIDPGKIANQTSTII